MLTSGSCARSLLAAVAAALIVSTSTLAGQSTHDVSIVLTHVSERLSQFYKRVQNIVCTEKLTAQNVGHDLSPVGFARVVESELRIEADDDDLEGEPKIVRSIVKINGRVPRPKDKEGCYDPNPLSEEPLAFLLPKNREEYAFSWGGFGKGKEQNLMILEYRAVRTGKPEMREHERDREDCYSFSMPGGTKGRVWIDAATHDVVRVEERLIGPIDFRTPPSIQRRGMNMPLSLQLNRYDRYVKYKAVKFDDPEETMLLPESVDELTVFSGGGSHRTQQRFSNYKRFLTGGRIVK